MIGRTAMRAAWLAATASLVSTASVAQQTQPAPAPTGAQAPAGIMQRKTLLGDLGGVRPALDNVGVTLGLLEQSEVFGNTTGGLKQGATYDGLTTLTIGLDTQKAFGWEGGTLNVSALQIHGRNLSQYYLANLNTASGIEAIPTTRLWEAWYMQSLLGGKLDLKLGLQSLDQDFLTSTGAAVFINTAMGWPILPSVDLYAGGPAYPLSSLGVRLRAHPTDAITVLAGVFQDNPPGGPFNNDSEVRGSSRWGGNFSLRTGALAIGEIQYALNPPPADDAPDEAKQAVGLPGTYKLGAYFDTADFPNYASAAGTIHQNHSIYGVADQMIWRPDPTGPRSVSVFLRILGAPGDRNLVDLNINAGILLKAPLPGRDDDSFGIGYGLTRIGGGARAADRLAATVATLPYPIRSNESFMEVTYQAQIAPWLQIQPDFQYVFRPSGGIPNPASPGKRIGDETIFGLRTAITF